MDLGGIKALREFPGLHCRNRLSNRALTFYEGGEHHVVLAGKVAALTFRVAAVRAHWIRRWRDNRLRSNPPWYSV
jgi:hypothetical protein